MCTHTFSSTCQKVVGGSILDSRIFLIPEMTRGWGQMTRYLRNSSNNDENESMSHLDGKNLFIPRKTMKALFFFSRGKFGISNRWDERI